MSKLWTSLEPLFSLSALPPFALSILGAPEQQPGRDPPREGPTREGPTREGPTQGGANPGRSPPRRGPSGRDPPREGPTQGRAHSEGIGFHSLSLEAERSCQSSWDAPWDWMEARTPGVGDQPLQDFPGGAGMCPAANPHTDA